MRLKLIPKGSFVLICHVSQGGIHALGVILCLMHTSSLEQTRGNLQCGISKNWRFP